jgi:hypothetical protein
MPHSLINITDGGNTMTAQQQNNTETESFFGKEIFSYTRAQAMEDGGLVDVSETAREAGFKIPVALTRTVWIDCVKWDAEDNNRQTLQDESGRLWDVLYMASIAARQNRTSSQPVLYNFLRIPRGGRGVRPKMTTLKIHIGPGDNGESVITIMQPNED